MNENFAYDDERSREAMTRERRTDELCGLKQTNPQRIIALYHDATSTLSSGQLPSGIGFTSMIRAIIDHESATGTIQSVGTSEARPTQE
jgi:hypothetical protein